MYYCALSLGALQHILPTFLVTCAIWCGLEYSFRELSLKARCTPEKLTILTKHSKTFFFNHVVKNIVNYQLQKFYLK